MPVCRVRDVAPAPRSSRKVLGVGDFGELSRIVGCGPQGRLWWRPGGVGGFKLQLEPGNAKACLYPISEEKEAMCFQVFVF